MAKKLAAQPPKAAKEAGNATGGRNSQAVEEVANKTEAVRRALDALGPDAKPLEIQVYVLGHFGIEVSTGVISVYKAKLAGGGRKRGRLSRRPRGEATAVVARPAARGSSGVSLQDLRAVKELGSRVGPRHFRELLDLLS
jgi:hypothetical protein